MPSCSWCMPSRRIESSPARSPAAFLPRPSSLSKKLIPASLRGLPGRCNRRDHKKRQIRKTLRPSGSDSARLTRLRAGVKGLGKHRPPVAKKTRTPAPPRKVQAPQRRSDPRRPSPWSERPVLWVGGALLALAVIAAAVGGYFVFRGGSSDSGPIVPQDAKLAGLQTGPAPWNPGLDTLPDRLDAAGVHALGSEGAGLHIHQHLDIYVNGKHQVVPQGVGIYDDQFLTELHTHDTTGIMHVESPVAQNFDLGQFFGVWGVRLNENCIGGYCKTVPAGEKTPWKVYVNGQPYTGNPAALVLKSHQEIVFAIGTPPKKIPAHYKFPGGL